MSSDDDVEMPDVMEEEATASWSPVNSAAAAAAVTTNVHISSFSNETFNPSLHHHQNTGQSAARITNSRRRSPSQDAPPTPTPTPPTVELAATPTTTAPPDDDDDNDMGYEECAPRVRRGSMTVNQEKERRASIQAVMADSTLSPITKRRSIQHLMDGRRNSINSTATSNNHQRFHRRRSSVAGGTSICSASTAGSSSHCNAAWNGNGSGFGDATLDGGGGGGGSGVPYATHRRGSTGRRLSADYGPFPLDEFGVPVTTILGYPNPTQDDDDIEGDDDDDDDNLFGGGTRGVIFVIANDQTRLAEQTRPPCPHYDRKCTMVAPCCGAAFGCRICHDECPALPPKINNGDRRVHRSASLPSSFTCMEPLSEVPQDNHHNIDRFAVVEVICRVCFTRQSSKANQCVSCHVEFGAYHCNICNLWMSDKEQPYHCVDCGFCRVGGADNFLHCHECGMCIDRSLYTNHNCKAGKYRSNCPVCQEYLFNSRGASHEMPCGHAIHWDCFRQMAAHDSRCPVCKKTAETRDRMMPTWTAMAAGIALQPVPPELSRVVNMTCNDCERNEDGVAWHFLGMQCSSCSSFNTVVDRILMQGEEAHEFLEMKRQHAAAMAESNVGASDSANEQSQSNVSGEVDPSRPGGERPHRVNRRRSAF